MIKTQHPWQAGPTELIEFALDRMHKGSDFDRRLAFLILDVGVETLFKTFLTLPDSVMQFQIKRSDRFEAVAGNFHVLTAPLQSVMVADLDPELVSGLWERARSEFEISIVDVGSIGDLNEITNGKRRVERLLVDALVKSDGVLVVVTPDPQSVARTLRALDALRAEIPDIPIQLVANRVPQKSGRGNRDSFSVMDAVGAFAERSLKIHQIPLDFDLFGRALNQGRAIAELAPRSPARKAIRQLAEDVWSPKVA